MISGLRTTIHHFFPQLPERLAALADPRAGSDYDIAEIVFAGIMLFIFKEGSRNAFNNDRDEGAFLDNYARVFNMRLPHMDTVDEVMRRLSPFELEGLKTSLIKHLIGMKVLAKLKLFGRYYCVARHRRHESQRRTLRTLSAQNFEERRNNLVS